MTENRCKKYQPSYVVPECLLLFLDKLKTKKQIDLQLFGIVYKSGGRTLTPLICSKISIMTPYSLSAHPWAKPARNVCRADEPSDKGTDRFWANSAVSLTSLLMICSPWSAVCPGGGSGLRVAMRSTVPSNHSHRPTSFVLLLQPRLALRVPDQQDA